MDYKTNVMRILDKNKIAYKAHDYDSKKAVSGSEVAEYLKQNPQRVFKTLVTQGKSKKFYVFVIPVKEELDLKKAASVVGEKSIEMIKMKDLLPTTGYIHGGCSPIGMKKLFKTTLHITAKDYDEIIFSAGKVGYQVELPASELEKIVPLDYADIIV